MKIEERSITHTTNQTAEFGPGGPFVRQGSTIKALIAQFSGFYEIDPFLARNAPFMHSSSTGRPTGVIDLSAGLLVNVQA